MRRYRPRPVALLLGALLVTAANDAAFSQDGFAGPYLAARSATVAGDYRAATENYGRALTSDPANPALMESAMMGYVGLGDFAAAIPFATDLKASGAVSQGVELVLLADQLQREDYAAVVAQSATRRIGPLVDGLVLAWAELGQGRMSEAQAGFDTLAATEGLLAYGLFHKALALASVGDFEGADTILSGNGGAPLRLPRNGVLARAQILAQLERGPEAVAVLDAAVGSDPDPEFAALRAAIVNGDAVPFAAIRSVKDGMAEVFFTVATALNGDASDGDTLVLARIAQYLRPDAAELTLLTASLLDSQGQFDLAVEAFNRITAASPTFYAAELGRAEALYKSGKVDAAMEVMAQLARTHGDLAIVQTSLGDMLRRAERYAEATRAYDAAIAIFGPPQPAHWAAYYTRGISYERTGRMDLAEADMRLALQLNPDQPQVLNYLGYSFVEQNRNLDEALSMIQRAVAARPQDGYIADSLGWVLYRLGRFAEAVAPMEIAAQLEAVDPVVSDHLGDVYWKVGRTNEAEFQWQRALSFDPAEADAPRIRRKLELGLDAVLAEEAAAGVGVAVPAAADAAPVAD